MLCYSVENQWKCSTAEEIDCSSVISSTIRTGVFFELNWEMSAQGAKRIATTEKSSKLQSLLVHPRFYLFLKILFTFLFMTLWYLCTVKFSSRYIRKLWIPCRRLYKLCIDWWYFRSCICWRNVRSRSYSGLETTIFVLVFVLVKRVWKCSITSRSRKYHRQQTYVTNSQPMSD